APVLAAERLVEQLNAAVAGGGSTTEALTQLHAVLQAVDEGVGVVSDEDRRLADAKFELGDALATQEGDLEGAMAEFCGALAANPRHADALCGLGSVLGEKGDLEASIKALRRALEVSPRHALAHFYLGSALGRRADFDGAILEYEAVLEYEPNSQAAVLARRNLESAAAALAESRNGP
ncbi:unnamed protein product, partial [Polarella glacialis]